MACPGCMHCCMPRNKTQGRLHLLATSQQEMLLRAEVAKLPSAEALPMSEIIWSGIAQTQQEVAINTALEAGARQSHCTEQLKHQAAD